MAATDIENIPGTAGHQCWNYSVADTVSGVVYDDWFLPSKDELNLMYCHIGPGNTLGFGNVGGFVSSIAYWSSTEAEAASCCATDFAFMAWVQAFGASAGASYGYHTSGKQFRGTKCQSFKVRAIRGF
tara:strand:- start:84 stop:467 length:384 start_codon:yes stop_codon:yes gene_type:complete